MKSAWGQLFLIRRGDWIASWVVFLVAVPLTLGVALASGASAGAAILTALIGAIFVGALSGSPLMVSGPAAGLSTLVFMIIQQHGFLGLVLATAVAGLLQVILGLLRLGFLFTHIPQSILYGMLAAIGLSIALGQMHIWFGSVVPESPLMALSSLPEVLGSISVSIFFLGLVGILIQLFWQRMAGPLKWLPGALPAVFFVSLLSLVMVSIPRIEIQPMGELLVSQLDIWREFSLELLGWPIFGIGIGLGIVASAESLLTARASDQLTEKIGIRSNLNLELLAQGFGNLVCSAFAALPLTGVMVRTAANIESGARSRASTILHGVWLALFILLIPGVLAQIPLVALASVLIVTGIKLLGIQKARQFFRSSPVDAFFWSLTLLSILGTNLLHGLLISLSTWILWVLARRLFRSSSRFRETLAVRFPAVFASKNRGP